MKTNSIILEKGDFRKFILILSSSYILIIIGLISFSYRPVGIFIFLLGIIGGSITLIFSYLEFLKLLKLEFNK